LELTIKILYWNNFLTYQADFGNISGKYSEFLDNFNLNRKNYKHFSFKSSGIKVIYNIGDLNVERK